MKLETQTSHWVKCVSTGGSIRGVALDATELVQAMARIHDLKGESARGLGEATLGALLIASYCKGGERVNLNIQGQGLYSQALVDAYPDGRVRGYVIARENPSVFEGMGPWGGGLLSVLRTKGEGNPPYIGTVPLLTGHLAKDLSFYWTQSEQVPSAVGLVVNLSSSGDVLGAGGFLIQAMPGAKDSEVEMIEKHIQEIHSFQERFSQNQDPTQLLSSILQSTAFVVLEKKPLYFECSCSDERVKRALTLVGTQELSSMLTEDQGASIRCDFCSKEYRIDAESLRKMITGASE